MSANVVGGRRLQASSVAIRRRPGGVLRRTDRLHGALDRKRDPQLPEGVYEAEGYRDDDGVTDEPIQGARSLSATAMSIWTSPVRRRSARAR